MRKKFLAAAAAAVALTATAGTVNAISDGTLDGDDHPYVGLMIAEDADGNPLWRCSGSLISPTIYVTAGHCTSGAAHVELWFTSDLEPDPSQHGYLDLSNPDDPSTWFVGEYSGTPYSHPLYNDNAFYLYDLGVVILDEPVTTVTEFASLPTPDDYGMVDDFEVGRKNGDTVTVVGYGLQELVEGPTHLDIDPKIMSDKTRYQAEVAVISVKGGGGIGSRPNKAPDSGSFITSGDPTTGGTCPGDSGGPNLVENDENDVIVGITSFGFNANCKGPGGAYRIDRAADVDWINCVAEATDPLKECYPAD